MAKIMKEAKQAGVDAILTIDCPLEESSEYFSCAKDASMSTIGLLSPSTEPERIIKICQSDPAFLYYVCRNGTTGVKDSLPEDYVGKIEQIKSLSNIPVVAGFGISTKEMASSAIGCADGFVVGSLFVKAISEGISPSGLQQLAFNLDPRERILI
jgi:tryptophan synthase alpha chain